MLNTREVFVLETESLYHDFELMESCWLQEEESFSGISVIYFVLLFRICVVLCITGFMHVIIVPVEASKGYWVLQN